MIQKSTNRIIKSLLFTVMVFTVLTSKAQVVSSIDKNEIKIGEQITYSIQATLDSTSQVVFPKALVFPLEVVKAPKADTLLMDGKWKILQKYQLTQFDSGHFQLPKLKVFIDSLSYETETYDIVVNDVAVDTTQQKMYDIKPIIQVEKSFQMPWNWIVLALILCGIAYGFYLYYKKGIEKFEKKEEALIPAFDKALSALEELEKSQYLIKEEYKEYYSQLTNIVRSYLEEEIHISALESTTEQLIDHLELLKDSGALDLDQQTIDRFDQILKTADLVKFARSKPELSKAESDREQLKEVVVKTKEAIPEPTEEELMQQEEFKQALLEAEKKRKMRHIKWAVATLVVALISTGVFYAGPKKVWDTLTFNSSKQLLESNWVNSSYGAPPIQLSTPKVLIRDLKAVPASGEAQRQLFSLEQEEFSIYLTTLKLQSEEEPNFDQIAESSIAYLETLGGKNIITRQEAYTTVDGVQGVKVFGRFTIDQESNEEKMVYELYIFGGKGFAQQLLLVHQENQYNDQIKQQLLGSIRLKEIDTDE